MEKDTSNLCDFKQRPCAACARADRRTVLCIRHQVEAAGIFAAGLPRRIDRVMGVPRPDWSWHPRRLRISRVPS